METQPGHVNWSPNNNALNKGEARAMAWQAVAHGADALLYWQWRSAPGGQEQYHGSLIGADGRPRPFYSEAVQIGTEFANAREALAGTAPKNEVAFLYSYDSKWAIDWQKHNSAFGLIGLLYDYYRPLAERNVGTDILSAEATLEGYKLIIVPANVILTETTARNLKAFVENGGTLVLTVRTGQKDSHNTLLDVLQPGHLRDIAGVEVEEYYALEGLVPIEAQWQGSSPEKGQGRIWAERLRPLTQEVQTLARFGESNGWLDGNIAAALHSVGEKGGKVVTVGVQLEEGLQSSLTDFLLALSGASPTLPEAPEGVEMARRVAEDGRAVTILINHNRFEVPVPLSTASQDILTGEAFTDSVSLPPYGVRVFTA
jgi:beta-galactosidase